MGYVGNGRYTSFFLPPSSSAGFKLLLSNIKAILGPWLIFHLIRESFPSFSLGSSHGSCDVLVPVGFSGLIRQNVHLHELCASFLFPSPSQAAMTWNGFSKIYFRCPDESWSGHVHKTSSPRTINKDLDVFVGNNVIASVRASAASFIRDKCQMYRASRFFSVHSSPGEIHYREWNDEWRSMWNRLFSQEQITY